MKTTAFDAAVATEVETAVIDVYGCRLSDIIQYRDSEVKKVVVFILYRYFGFNWKLIAVNYRMTYLYVPTVATELEYWHKTDVRVREKIDLVLSKVQSLKMAV